MFKSIQIRILLIIILLAIIMFGTSGYFYITKLKDLGNGDLNVDNVQVHLNQVKSVMIVIISSFILISFVIVLFTSRRIIFPISKLIKSANKIAER